MTAPRVCMVMSFNSRMFAQAQQALSTFRQFAPPGVDVHVLALDLARHELDWLAANKVQIHTEVSRIPIWKDAPLHAYSMTCRPWMPQLFPGYDIYLWVDADIRFCDREGVEFYLHGAAASTNSIVASLEVDPTYHFVCQPRVAAFYHREKYARVRQVYGEPTADHLAYMYCYNMGLFAMHRQSPLWAFYEENVRRAVATPYNHMKEQDAMNVAIVQSGLEVHTAHPVMNWLCSISFPRFARQVNRWVRPESPHVPISVLHLTNSNDPSAPDGLTFYEVYKQQGLTL